jgi:hypothetical protein
MRLPTTNEKGASNHPAAPVPQGEEFESATTTRPIHPAGPHYTSLEDLQLAISIHIYPRADDTYTVEHRAESELKHLLDNRYQSGKRHLLEIKHELNEMRKGITQARAASKDLWINATMAFLAVAAGPLAGAAKEVFTASSDLVLNMIATAGVAGIQSALPLLGDGSEQSQTPARGADTGYEEAVYGKLRQKLSMQLKPYMDPASPHLANDPQQPERHADPSANTAPLNTMIVEEMRRHHLNLPINEAGKNRLVRALQNRLSSVVANYLSEVRAQLDALQPEKGKDVLAADKALRLAMGFGHESCHTTQRMVDIHGNANPLLFSQIDSGDTTHTGQAIDRLLTAQHCESASPLLASAVTGGLKPQYHAAYTHRFKLDPKKDPFRYKRKHMLAAMRIVEDVIFNVTGDASRSIVLLTAREKLSIVDTLIKVALQTPHFSQGKHRRSNPMLYLLNHFKPLASLVKELPTAQLSAIIRKHQSRGNQAQRPQVSSKDRFMLNMTLALPRFTPHPILSPQSPSPRF